MCKKLKVRVIIVFTLIFLLVISIMPYIYNGIIKNDYIGEQEALGNNYEKYTGEKITLNVQSEELSGAWGKLKLTPFILEPSEDFIKKQINFNDLYDKFYSSSKWIFKDTDIEEIRSLFLKAGLSKSTCDKLIANTSAITNGKGFITTPPDEVFWSLTAENRAELYPLIGKYSDNIMYNEPIYYGSSNSNEWLYNSGMRKEIVETLQKLIYVEDGVSYISDMHLILPLLKDDGEKIKLLQLVFRTRTLDVKLKITEGQDVSKIVDYWGRFGHKEQIKLVLERVRNISGGGEIDISELLPQIPQSRLNSYSGSEEYETDFKDCHWTTINFFNKDADESYYDAADLLSVINEFSEPIKNLNPVFGDVISIFNENNEVTHSCTYIADNLVLTKNGTGNLNPFVITYLDKTAPLYGDKIVYYHRTIGDTHSIDLNG